MAKGGITTQRVDIIDNYDPSIVGRAAAKGTLFRFIPNVGTPTLFIKLDNGFSTNWINFSAGSSAEVIEVASFALLPSPGASGVIYITTDTNNIYRWNGTGYSLLNQCAMTISALIFG